MKRAPVSVGERTRVAGRSRRSVENFHNASTTPSAVVAQAAPPRSTASEPVDIVRPAPSDQHIPALRPPSATSSGTIIAGMCGLLIAIVAMRYSSLAAEYRTLVALAAAALPMITVDLYWYRVHRRDTTGLVWDQPWQIAPARVATKLLGAAATLAAVAAPYIVLREYAQPFYRPYWSIVTTAGPWIAAALIPYVIWVDGRQRDPKDGLWHVGRLVLGSPEPGWRAVVSEHARGWAIKAFFLPLMSIYATSELDQLYIKGFALQEGFTYVKFYEFTWSLIFTFDVMFGTLGYALSLRAIDSHIRSAEPTPFGWIVTVICYQPFWGFMFASYLNHVAGPAWSAWLGDQPVLHALWGSTILLLMTIYGWATVSFGCRFSNLTHRGIITAGPYRFTKHPAYVSKNLAYWLIYVPWAATASASFGEAVRCCLLLLCVNGIYVLRAWTEERHLSRDPVYRQYASFIDRRGLFHWLQWWRLPRLDGEPAPRPAAAPVPHGRRHRASHT